MLTWDQLRADLARALERHCPERAEHLLRQLERRHGIDPRLLDDTEPQLPALLEIADAVRACFPDRGDEMLAKLRRVLEDDDDRGHVTMRREDFLARIDAESEDLPMPRLTVVRGPGVGRFRWIDRARILIGRSPSCDLVLLDPATSRRHAEVYVQAGRLFIADQRSLNGTQVNQAKLEPLTDTPLANGDRIKCGSVVLAFRDPRATASA